MASNKIFQRGPGVIPFIWKYRKIAGFMLAVIVCIILAFFVSDILAMILGLGSGLFLGKDKIKEWTKKPEQDIDDKIIEKETEIKDHEKIVSDLGDDALVDMAKDLRKRRKR